MSNFLSPHEISNSLVDVGIKKANNSFSKLLVLGIIAGVYIGFAAHLATTIGTGFTEWVGFKRFIVGSVFSVGLVLVIIAGSELWTGNNLMTVALFQRKISFSKMLRNWVIVYLGNFIGSIIIAIIIAKYTGLLDGAIGGNAIKIAHAKITSTSEGINHNIAYLFRAIGCNWLVCLAVLIAMSAKDIAGKIMGIFFPIMAFVASGFEHSIANMYFIPAGIFAQDFNAAIIASGLNLQDLTAINWVSMWTSNILIVTLGNFIGGSLMVGGTYWFLYVRESKPLSDYNGILKPVTAKISTQKIKIIKRNKRA